MNNDRELAKILLRVTLGAQNVRYALVNFVLLRLSYLNHSSVGDLAKRGLVMRPSPILIGALSGALILGISMPRVAGHLRETTGTEPAQLRFKLDPGQSKFIAHGLRGGLFWFKGHEHLVAAREFTGEVEVTPGAITPASLQLTVNAASMEETSSVFTEPQKQIINKELREIVLEPAKYPEIVFKSTEVTGKLISSSEYDVKIKGNLMLHGVTKRIEIPAKVTLTGNNLRAIGEFSIDRSDFNVKATSAFHGLVRVRNKVKFTFNIVGHQI